MRKAIVILATSVAFLLSGQAFAVRQTIDTPLEGELIRSAETVDTLSTGYKTYKNVPTTIPLGTKAVTVPVKAVRTVPVSRVTSLARSGLKNNLASVALNLTVIAAIEGVGWVMSDDNTKLQKITYQTSTGQDVTTGLTINPQQICNYLPASQVIGHSLVTTYQGVTWIVVGASTISDLPSGYSSNQNYCTNSSLGYTFDSQGNFPAIGSKPYAVGDVTSHKSDLTDSDWSVLDGFIKGKDGVWQRDLSSGICDSLPNPQACYESLPDTRILTGPETVTAPPSTSTSTSSDGTTKTTTQTPSATITYGDTYIDYEPTITTTTNTTNNNGTTTETETSDAPTVPDALAGINDPLGGLPGEIEGQGSSISPLGYHSWFSMGGSCKEHSFDLPVVGVLTTNYCPIHEAYVRPFLAFMFALWTWHYCFQIWRESVTRVRAD
ncbi:hypothetical protein [Pseudomonas sp. NBRC 100443]|uniref:hypothetical protein n=1 Tax=Pseudomonas sp. NBRC 100443 TaxID=1113665 RepID=UPI0024A23B92|nr:hypothetical protein [Pseudomonas sp. NBRC 100443]GLU36572.1 hypothetical protein Pssp01_06650 [Pseudomonas sp. NBRC 100443]GLU36581.1 hypothetical protein Pssp01_06740 [Pseudomonas sp. NBRC 100443]